MSKLYPRPVQKNVRRTVNCTPLAFMLRTFKLYVVATVRLRKIHYVAHRKYWTVVQSRKSSGALFSTKGQLRNLSGGEFTGPPSSPYKIVRTPPVLVLLFLNGACYMAYFRVASLAGHFFAESSSQPNNHGRHRYPIAAVRGVSNAPRRTHRHFISQSRYPRSETGQIAPSATGWHRPPSLDR